MLTTLSQSLDEYGQKVVAEFLHYLEEYRPVGKVSEFMTAYVEIRAGVRPKSHGRMARKTA